MFTLRFETATYAPDLEVTLRVAPAWSTDVPGLYEDGAWVFRLQEDRFPRILECKFVLERVSWMKGGNLAVEVRPDADVTFTEAEVAFDPLPDVAAESGVVSRAFFPGSRDEARVYDAIVIGSGAGGGVLASRLAVAGADVLVLEAGAYLFPTHVANLPRRLVVGKFDKHVWGLWPDFSVATYENEAGSEFRGRQSFNLGGRSVFWGGLIPELGAWELEGWPAAVRDYLRPTGFRLANELLNRSLPTGNAFQARVKALLQDELPGYTHFDAPMAVQYQGYTPSVIPAGMFSTADLLLQHALIRDEAHPARLTVNLNHFVTELVTDGQRVVGVVADDRTSHTVRTFRARNVILCAGTIESAKIALRSGLADPAGLIGRGLTDHTILYTHFSLPSTAEFFAVDQAAKVWSRPTSEVDVRRTRFNAVLELGADFNQARYVDAEHLRHHQEDKRGSMLCELVFLFETALGDDNFVALAGPPPTPARVRVDRMPLPEQGWDEAQSITAALFARLGAEAITGETLDLKFADLGGVAHEVGTLRMTDSTDGVVDADLRFLDYENLFACDNSVFPTSPAANPTLTLVALALRLAKHLTSQPA